MTTASNGHAHSARADVGTWIVAAYTRHDLPQVITASVKGTVRFWDIRNMRVYKTLDVFKHPLTALAVHRCLPIMATGSHAQVVKVFTMGGDQLDRDIKYHDGFLGQRIGPVSCLAFHPNKMMLASGASDNLVSIYSPADFPI
jgi:regulatory associated protein of mTOR